MSKVSSSVNYNNASLGQHGYKVIADGQAASVSDPSYSIIIIQVLEDTTISTVATKGDNLSGVAVSAGTLIRGVHSNVTLTGGSAILYSDSQDVNVITIV